MQYNFFDTLFEPVFVVSKDKVLLYCNEAAASMCDLSVKKILRTGSKFDELFKFDLPVAELDALESLTDATPYQEVSFKNSGDISFTIQISLQKFEDNYLIYFRDVTLEAKLQKKYRSELEQKEGVIEDLKKAHLELEQYSKNLEKMVAERTAELQNLNLTLSALIDSLGQGFFIFNNEGLCLNVFSKACLRLLESSPAGLKAWDVLNMNTEQTLNFKNWMTTIFAEMLPFEDLAELGPQSYKHSQNLNIQLSYHPIRNADGAIESVVVMATDITDLVSAKKLADQESSYVKLILHMIKNKRQIYMFVDDAHGLIENLKNILKHILQQKSIDTESLFRILHTLKGGAASISLKELADICHDCENDLVQFKSTQNPEFLQHIKTKSILIESCLTTFLSSHSDILGDHDHKKVEIPAENLFSFRNLLNDPALIEKFDEDFLTEPIENYFSIFNEPVKNIAEREGKQVSPIKFVNGDLKIYADFYVELFSNVIHCFRNAADHGIEAPELRTAAGKPEAGQITVEFNKINNLLEIKISDDGGGIDPALVRNKLKEKNIGDDQTLSDQAVIQAIFMSDFSTKSEITDISGRGVGMDAVLTSAKKIGGIAWVESQKAKGTTIVIRVPFMTYQKSSAQAA